MSDRRNHLRRQAASGVSMLEVVVSLTLVSTILFVSLNASVNVFRNRALAMDGVRAQALAGKFLDEITVMPFRDQDANASFGVEDDENVSNRTTFDDVDDYRDWNETTPTHRDGALIDGYDGWQVDINVAPFRMVGESLSFTTDALSTIRLVTVVVNSPGGLEKTFRALISSTGNDLPADQSFERTRRVTVRFSADREMELLVPLRNQPEPVY